MKNYEVNNSVYGTHHLIANEISEDLKVLDVGCNAGYMKSLVGNCANFSGLDLSETALKVAKENGYKYVEKIDLDCCEYLKLKESFDVIIFADILEHLKHPQECLKFFIEKHLADNGMVIISLPNVAHLSVRVQLLLGRFNYTDSGILDKTHLHLYTLKTAKKLITQCGLWIEKEKFSSNRFGRAISFFPSLGGLLGFNLLFFTRPCQKKSS